MFILFNINRAKSIIIKNGNPNNLKASDHICEINHQLVFLLQEHQASDPQKHYVIGIIK
jgi:hypothetical protein